MLSGNGIAWNVKVIWFFMARHKLVYVTLAGIGLVVGVMEGFSLAIFAPLLDFLIAGGKSEHASQGMLLQWISKIVEFFPIEEFFLGVSALFLGVILIKGFTAILYEYIAAKASGDILHIYRQELIRHYRDAPLSHIEKNTSGYIVYNITKPPVQIAKLLYVLSRIVMDVLRIVFVVLLMLYFSPLLTLGLAFGGALIYISSAGRLSGYSYALSLDRQRAERNMSNIVTEWYRGIRPIRASASEAHWLSSFRQNSSIASSKLKRVAFLSAIPKHIIEMGLFVLLLVWLGVVYIVDQATFSENITIIGVFAMGLARILPTLTNIARAPIDIKALMPDVEYLYSALSEPLPRESNGNIIFTKIENGIEARDLFFSFKDRGLILNGLTLLIPAKKVTALVGTSGAGKSVLLNVLVGLLPLDSGTVSYDETSICDIDRQSLFRRVGYVDQNTTLFQGTLGQNIAFFRKDVSASQVRKAAEIAEIHGFIESLPKKYETIVGEGAFNLSGGQAQRIVIARALVCDPEILIMDEPTSALDHKSEELVIHALQSASRNRTVIIVSHKLATVKWVDQVVVLDKGRIAAKGSWIDVVENKSSPLYKMSFGQDTE